MGLDAGFPERTGWNSHGRLLASGKDGADMYCTVGPTLPDTFGATAPKGNYADMSTYG